MKRKITSVFFIFIIISGLYIAYEMVVERYYPYRHIDTELKSGDHEPVLSIFQTSSSVPFTDTTTVKHLILTINGKKQWQVKDWSLLKKVDENIPVLLTIELWDRGVIRKTEAGEYNEKIKDLFSKNLAHRKNLYIRWNPEMEVPESGLPWGNLGYPYASAFQQFTDLCRESLPHAKVVWGPAGFPGLMENYPGRNNLDMASLTMNSDSEKKLGKTPLPFEEQLKRKLHRMRFLQVPIFILGSRNTDIEDFRFSMVADVIEEIAKEKEEIDFKNPLSAEQKENKGQRKSQLLIGVFDPGNFLINEQGVSVEHIFINFKDIQKKAYLQEIREIFKRQHDAIITVEPGLLVGQEGNDRLILEMILAGEYDGIFEQFYCTLPVTQQTIYLRFAHEMEIPIQRYPWQSQDPVDYIKAYRYFMQFSKEEIPNIKKVWGPAGDRGLMEWWPGGDVVDVISIAIYGLPDKNITDPKKQESFGRIYKRKKSRLALLHKPLFITEFGVKGDEEFQAQWLVNAAKVIKSDSLIMGLSYFNREDVPEAWGEIDPPQWQISKKTFRRFMAELK